MQQSSGTERGVGVHNAVRARRGRSGDKTRRGRGELESKWAGGAGGSRGRRARTRRTRAWQSGHVVERRFSTTWSEEKKGAGGGEGPDGLKEGTGQAQEAFKRIFEISF